MVKTGAAAPAAEGTASLDKALDVLDAVGLATSGLSQAALGAQLGLPRTTLYRLLGTLVARGLLRRDPLRRVYCLGARCIEYARAAYALPDLVAAASLELRALRDMSGETSYLGALDGLEVIALERIDGAHPQRSQTQLGQRKPLHCTSQGKALLSALKVPQREALVKEMAMQAVTPHSITDRRRLLGDLALSAARGWTIDDEENVLGVRCCGAPIIDAQGELRGAISVAGPAFRFTLERLALLGPEVAEAARRIGAQLAPSATPAAAGEVQLLPGPWAFQGGCVRQLGHPGAEATGTPLGVPSGSTGPASAVGTLLWADCLAPAVHRWAPIDGAVDGPRELARLDAPVDALLPAGQAALLFSAGQWWQLDASSGALKSRPDWTLTRFSAVAAGPQGPQGALWACVPEGEQWRVANLNPQASRDPAQTGAPFWRLPEAATAMVWNEAGDGLLIACAGSGTLYRARTGQPHIQRLATVPQGSGQLGGLALDRQGGIWTALSGGWSVLRFDPDGSVSRVVALPVPNPTDLAFGGPSGTTLLITSARNALNREALDAAPLSGRLFSLEVTQGGQAAWQLGG